MGVFFLLTLIYCNILESIIVCFIVNDIRRITHLLLFRMPHSVQRCLPYSVCLSSYSLSTDYTIYHSRNAILRTGTLHLSTCIEAIRVRLTDNFCSKKIVTVPLIVAFLSDLEQSAGPTQDNQLAHSYQSCIHFSRSCDNLVVMGYFNTQPMKTVLKSSSSSSSSFYVFNSRKYIIRISKAKPKLVHYGNYNNIQFFVLKTEAGAISELSVRLQTKWLWV